MASKINLIEFAEILAQKSKKSKSFSANFVRNFFELIKSILYDDNYVKVKGLGIFKLMTVSGRESVDVNTGERIEISEHERLVFIPDKSLAEHVNRPFGNFATTILDDNLSEEIVGQSVSAEAEENVGEQTENTVAESTAQAFETDAEASVPTPSEEKVALESDERKEQGTEQEESETIAAVSSIYLGDEGVEADPEDIQTNGEAREMTLPENGKSEENDVSEESMEEKEEEDETEPKKNKVWKVLLGTACVLILMGACYIAGYNHVVDIPLGNNKTKPAKLLQLSLSSKKDSAKVVSRNDSLTTVAKDSAKEVAQQINALKEESSKYKQLPGAERIIAGTWKTHTMKSGDNLYRIAKLNYGDKEFAKYIIFYNGISNPDKVSLGTKLNLPILLKRDQQ